MKNVKHLVAMLVVVLLIGLTLFAIAPNTAKSDSPTVTPTAMNVCQAILTRAFEVMRQTCNNVERNRACYGNNNVTAQLSDAATGPFSNPGDKLPIQVIKVLSTSPMNMANQTWGLSLLKLQANLPDTLPGQNVLFLVYGDTSISNQSGDMKTFYIASGLNIPTCKDAPADGVVVHSPDHMRVTFTVNGVKISIASTIIIHAVPKKEMTVQLVEGHADVSTSLGSRTLLPGQVLSVQLGGTTGLDPISAPSLPTATTLDPSMIGLVTTTQTIDDPQKSTDFSLSGCISGIQGNVFTIYGYSVTIPPTTSGIQSFKVGDCLQIEGNLLENADGAVMVAAVNVTLIDSASPTTNEPTTPPQSVSITGNNNSNANPTTTSDTAGITSSPSKPTKIPPPTDYDPTKIPPPTKVPPPTP